MSKKQAAKIETIEAKLWRGFTWAETVQGHNYWAEVVRNLFDLRQAELRKTKGVKK